MDLFITQLEKIQMPFTKHETGMHNLPYHERLRGSGFTPCREVKCTALSRVGELLKSIPRFIDSRQTEPYRSKHKNVLYINACYKQYTPVDVQL